MLKSLTATMWYTSRSYSRPYVRSSHAIESLSDCIAQSSWSKFSFSDQIASRTLRPDIVVKLDSMPPRSPATSAKRYDGLRNGSSNSAQWRPPSASPLPTSLPLESSTGNLALSASILTE
eukprot:scaffold91472_cov31-Tisochrysis_lutea.AAC.8